ncbi:DUF6924 domain-containing protein [Nocardia grenadensis]|uniref:DUF6924 domain-containing protein n=1 Tax=Nocardia grenadensis TaxID=931537 RepID=UPI003D8BB4FC
MSLFIRTDFGDDEAWRVVAALAMAPGTGEDAEFVATLTCIDNSGSRRGPADLGRLWRGAMSSRPGWRRHRYVDAYSRNHRCRYRLRRARPAAHRRGTAAAVHDRSTHGSSRLPGPCHIFSRPHCCHL